MISTQRTPEPRPAGPGQPALHIAGLAKSFGDTAAVRDVELSVPAGTFLGLVGPNGAGKTTLLSMAVGLLRPDRGTACVLGQDVWSAAGASPAKRLIGALPEGPALPQRLTGRELLTYLGLLRGAAGLAPLSSLISVQPTDETGNPTPAWSLKVHVMLVVVALTATVLVLVLASAGHLTWLSWAAVPAGVATGVVLAGYLGRRAARRLETRQVSVLKVLADAAR